MILPVLDLLLIGSLCLLVGIGLGVTVCIKFLSDNRFYTKGCLPEGEGRTYRSHKLEQEVQERRDQLVQGTPVGYTQSCHHNNKEITIIKTLE